MLSVQLGTLFAHFNQMGVKRNMFERFLAIGSQFFHRLGRLAGFCRLWVSVDLHLFVSLGRLLFGLDCGHGHICVANVNYVSVLQSQCSEQLGVHAHDSLA